MDLHTFILDTYVHACGPAWIPLAIPLARLRRPRKAEAVKPKPKSRSRESRPHAWRGRSDAGCAGAAPATVAGGTAGAATDDAAAGPAAATAAKRRTVASAGMPAASRRSRRRSPGSRRFRLGVHNNLGAPRLETRPRRLQIFRQRGSAKPKHFQCVQARFQEFGIGGVGCAEA